MSESQGNRKPEAAVEGAEVLYEGRRNSESNVQIVQRRDAAPGQEFGVYVSSIGESRGSWVMEWHRQESFANQEAAKAWLDGKYPEHETSYEAQLDAPAAEAGQGAPALTPSGRKPAYGVLVDHGAAHYKHDPKQSMSYYAKLRQDNGREREVWGKEIGAAIQDSGVQVGQRIELAHMGSRAVTIDVDVWDGDKKVGVEKKETHVNAWQARELPKLERTPRPRRQREAAADAGPGLPPTSPPLPTAPLASQQAPQRDVTQPAQPIAKDIQQHETRIDPALARSFARYENAFEIVGRKNLETARAGGLKLDIDVAEQLDTRLGRAEDGHLESRYLENSHSGHPGAVRMQLQDYVATLRQAAIQAEKEQNPGLAVRYEAQAKFELACHDGRAHEREGSARQRGAMAQQTDANADLAKADLLGRSTHMTTAEARLDQVAPQSRSEWIRDTFNTSELRASLDIHTRDAYDYYRADVGKRLAEQKGVEPSTYSMTASEVARFDVAFVDYQDARLRGVSLAMQRMAEQGRGSEMPPAWSQATRAAGPEKEAPAADIHGTRKESEAGLNKVPQPVAVQGFESKRAADGRTVEYSKQGQQEVAFRDVGEKVSVRSGETASSDVLRGALTVASKKFKRISLSGSKEFRERAAREAVHMGLADRIHNKELQSIIQDEQQKVRAKELGATQQAQGPALGATEKLQVQIQPDQVKSQDKQQQAGLGATAPTLGATPLSSDSQRQAAAARDRQAEEALPDQRTAHNLAHQHQGSTKLEVKLMDDSQGRGAQQAGDQKLPVKLMDSSKEQSREALKVVTEESSMSAGRHSQGEGVSR
ncbi:LPD7 domain-containing protein [Roseateles sp. MS654]|uniref:LPD7 domain-containing protein n=1 Tax=Roseateles sp. MS654 TaxID=3412685 RepID=UPI003C2BFE4F